MTNTTKKTPKTKPTHLGLQHGILRIIILQHIQQKRSRLPNRVPRQKHIGQRIQINRGPRLLGHHLGEVDRRLRVGHHHGLHEVHVIRLIPLAFGVVHECIKIPLGSEGLDDLGSGIGPLVETQGCFLVTGLAEEVTELFTGGELFLLENWWVGGWVWVWVCVWMYMYGFFLFLFFSQVSLFMYSVQMYT